MNRKDFLQSAGLMALGTSLMPLTASGMGNDPSSFFNKVQKPKSTYDVIVIGGSYAGLSTALTLARCLRNVLVIDTGKPRNRFAEKAHNGLLMDGLPPQEIQKIATEQLQAYKSYVDKLEDEAIDVKNNENEFTIATKNSGECKAGYVVFATGAKDDLPAIKGLKEHWGKTVHHCPYCYGFESSKGKTLLLTKDFQGLELLGSLQHWSEKLVVAFQTQAAIPDQLKGFMEKQSITWTKENLVEVRSVNKGQQTEIVYEGGNTEKVDHIYLKPQTTYQTKLAEKLGCETNETKRLTTDDFMLTSQPGIYAVGDISSKSMGQIIWAANSGMLAGVHINNQMIANALK